MQKWWSHRLAVLAVAAVLAVSGCAGSGEKSAPPELGAVKEVAALRAPMTESVIALADLKAEVGGTDLGKLHEAYDRFAAAFGQVLGPVSFQDTRAAQRMANANTALQEALAQKEPEVAAIAAQADLLAREMSRTAEQLGIPLMASASASVGAQVARRPATVKEVVAKEYRFTPARIEVKKGEPVTIRLRNAGTEKHMWRLDAFGVAIKPIAPGQTAEVTFTPDQTGTFEFACHVDGHYEKGMKGFFIVR